MYITEIFFNRISLDLFENKKIRYNIQANDITEIKDRQASYTDSYELPKTAHNVAALGGLGIPSDTSPYPYQKPECMVTIEGFPIIVKGWINITETGDTYKVYVYSGIVQFFKAIANKTLGDDLNVEELDHVKNLTTVLASFDNPYYRYLITDYNGLTHFGASDDTINIDYLVPSVNVKYLWDKIHSTFGFTYEGVVFDDSKFTNLWMTYPKPIPVDNTVLEKEAIGNQNIGNVNVNTSDVNNFYRQLVSSDLENPNKEFVVPAAGDYKIIFEADLTFNQQNDRTVSYYASVNQEGVPFSSRVNVTTLGSFPHINQSIRTESIITNLSQDDVISFYSFLYMSNGAVHWNTSFKITIYRFEGAVADFSEELKGFKITDFVIDILNMFGLTAFTSEHNNVIDYKLMSERLVTAETIDWTSKYMGRTKETYVYNSYAQRNEFAFQYNDKESDYNNGAIGIQNLNLEESKTVFTSKTYSPEKDKVTFNFGSYGTKQMSVFRLYDKDIRESNGEQTINYKGLDKRFHFIRSNSMLTNVKIGSKTLNNAVAVTSLVFGDFSGLTWRELINSFYLDYGRILNDSRLHYMDLYLYVSDMVGIDLKKLYYFDQEQQYYFINKISFDGEGPAKAEMVRVKYEPTGTIIPVDPINPDDYAISIVWNEDGTNGDKTSVSTFTTVQISTFLEPDDDPIDIYDWEVDTGSGFVSVSVTNLPLVYSTYPGLNRFRMKCTTESGYIFYSNVLNYTRIVVNCHEYTVSAFLTEGVSLDIFFTDCNNEMDYRSYTASTTETHEETFCAKIGAVSYNLGTLTDNGNCV